MPNCLSGSLTVREIGESHSIISGSKGVFLAEMQQDSRQAGNKATTTFFGYIKIFSGDNKRLIPAWRFSGVNN
jgi:hypothetical protein